MIATYENNHTGRTITGEFNRFAFDAVHDPAYHELYRTACDKLTAKQYVADQIGEQYVAPLLAVGDSPEEVMAKTNRDQYILKYNLNSGKNSFVVDGRLVSPHNMVIHQTKGWYIWENRDGYFFSEPILSRNIYNWEFYCHEGDILLVQHIHWKYDSVKIDPASVKPTDRVVTYPELQPVDWIVAQPHQSLIELGIDYGDRYSPKGNFRKAENWDEMVDLAKQLSAPFPIVRCDMMEADGKVVFGEFTATFRSFDVSELSGKYLMEKIKCH